ncbi:267_t:CDS:2, partial [Gigaspora margarita]
KYLEEETVDNNKSQEFECKSMVSEFSDIDESVKQNSIVFGFKVADELDDWDEAKRQVQNHAMEKINLNLSDSAIRIILLNNEHNHLLYKNIKCISSKHRCLNPEMLNQVEFLVNIGYKAVKTDASETYRRLMQLQYEETAIDLALQLDQENELNMLLLDWIKEKETKIYNKQLDYEISISNPYQIHTKGAQKKHLKSALDDVSNAIANKQYNSKTDKNIGSQSKYVCSNCKSTGHNACTLIITASNNYHR